MKRLLVLGGGTAGTIVANRLRRRLDRGVWQITVIDRDDLHPYQPGYLFIPFGVHRPEEVTKPRHRFLAGGVNLVLGDVAVVDPDRRVVMLIDGRRFRYDFLIVASGTSPRPDQTPGMLGRHWRRSIFDFYTLEGASALTPVLDAFPGGRIVVHTVDTPIKCPVAPLEFAFLVEAFFRHRGMRDQVEIVYATPLAGAFTKPLAAARLGSLLEDRKILIEPDFLVERVDERHRSLVSYDDRDIPFDLLVTVPLNMGADFVARSGLGDELNYVPVDRHTLLSTASERIFALGDAADLPTSKAGSVAHFSAEVLADNFVDHVAGRPMTRRFDGHTNCFVESGDGRGLLIDFNYDVEPLPGAYPIPVVGPLRLLEEHHRNHWAKLAFRYAYWHLLLPGRRLPVPSRMTMAGKHRPEPEG